MANQKVDARRLLCPMPVIRLQEHVDKANPGDTISIEFTDPGGRHDIPAWCRINGHKLIEDSELEDGFRITVEVVAQA